MKITDTIFKKDNDQLNAKIPSNTEISNKIVFNLQN